VDRRMKDNIPGDRAADFALAIFGATEVAWSVLLGSYPYAFHRWIICFCGRARDGPWPFVLALSQGLGELFVTDNGLQRSLSCQDVGTWAAWLHRQPILVLQRHLAMPRSPTDSIVRIKR
jgi:hypothetical protein